MPAPCSMSSTMRSSPDPGRCRRRPRSMRSCCIGSRPRGSATEALLAAAAVLGERARVDQVVGLAGIIGDEALDEAVGAGLLQSTPGDGHVAFVHPLVQAAVYHDLAPSRRAALHQRAASIVDGARLHPPRARRRADDRRRSG